MTLFTPIIDKKGTPYCGPTAIAVLTGVPITRIEKMIWRCRRGGYKTYDGRKIAIKGTYASECLKVLKRLGCKVEKFKFAEGSFAKFVDDTRHAGTFFVRVTGHFMVCSGGMFADTSYQNPTPIEGYANGKRRVIQAWKVIAPAMPKFTIEDQLTATRAPKPKRDIKEVRAEKVEADIKRWERKAKLAKTKLTALYAKRKRYEKIKLLS